MPIAAFWPLGGAAPAPLVVTPNPALSPEDFLESWQARLPLGRAWRRDPDAVMTRFGRGIADFYAGIHAEQRGLLADAFPATAVGLLPEWEASLGLPDPCIGPPATIGERQALAIQRLAARGLIDGAQSVPMLVAAAKALGITLAVTEYRNARAGRLRCGGRLYGRSRATPRGVFRAGAACGGRLADWSSFVPAGDWDFALTAVATVAVERVFRCGGRAGERLADWSAPSVTTISPFRAGGHCGGRLRQWGNRALECTLQRLKPAHAVLGFAYTGSEAWLVGVPVN